MISIMAFRIVKKLGSLSLPILSVSPFVCVRVCVCACVCPSLYPVCLTFVRFSQPSSSCTNDQEPLAPNILYRGNSEGLILKEIVTICLKMKATTRDLSSDAKSQILLDHSIM